MSSFYLSINFFCRSSFSFLIFSILLLPFMFLDLEWPISRVCTMCKGYASLVIKTISILYDGGHDYRPPREWNFSHPPKPRDLNYSVKSISDAVNPSVESKKSGRKTRVNEFLLNVLNIWGLRSNLNGFEILVSFYIPNYCILWSFKWKLDL